MLKFIDGVIELAPKNLVAELKMHLESFCTLAKQNGVEIKPYSQECLDQYAAYPLDIQKKIYLDFAKNYSAVLAIHKGDIPFKDTGRSLWRLFRKFGFKPTNDLFTVIKPTDVIEIYLTNHVQWYRSFNYFDFTSYTLGDLICYPWTDLIEHERDHSKQFMQIAEGIFKNEIRNTVFLELGPSISKERRSVDKIEARLNAKAISPLSNLEGHNEGLIVVWEIELANKISISAGLPVELHL